MKEETCSFFLFGGGIQLSEERKTRPPPPPTHNLQFSRFWHSFHSFGTVFSFLKKNSCWRR